MNRHTRPHLCVGTFLGPRWRFFGERRARRNLMLVWPARHRAWFLLPLGRSRTMLQTDGPLTSLLHRYAPALQKLELPRLQLRAADFGWRADATPRENGQVLDAVLDRARELGGAEVLLPPGMARVGSGFLLPSNVFIRSGVAE